MALVKVIESLDAAQPVTDQLEAHWPVERKPKWYTCQKEHLIGWLGEYDTPGYYGRMHPRRDAKFAYNHFNCAPGLLWLAEALGEDRAVLERAVREIKKAGANPSAQSGAYRRVIPWARIEELLREHKSRLTSLGDLFRIGHSRRA